MFGHRNLKLVKLFVLAAVFLVAAAACMPETFGVWVNMDSAGTTDDGVDYDRNDILFVNVYTDTVGSNWVLAFDGEEYGLTDKKHDIAGFSFNKFVIPIDFVTTEISDIELYLTFEANRAPMPGMSERAFGQDVVKFTLDTSGVDPVYSYEMFFDGSDVGLTKAAEKLDGITVWPREYIEYFGPSATADVPLDCHAGVIFVSTRGNYRVPDNLGGYLKGDGSDVLAFCATNTGQDTAGFWYRVFDGSEAGIHPPNAMTGLDVFLTSFEQVPAAAEESGNADFSAAFFFVARKTFTANGGVFGGPSEVFLGAYDSSSNLHEVEGPISDFNNDDGAPALNGLVESVSLFDIFFPTTP